MSNLPHDHVHRLIHSMTRAEKRYFKLYVARHVVSGRSNHRELFDAIASMAIYDEKTLHERFAGKTFMRRFSITKRRLYETILNSLDAFHADSSIDAKLRRSLHHVEILHRRALYADAAKVLRSVRNLAREHDRQAVLLQVAEWERRALERNNYSGIAVKDLEVQASLGNSAALEWQEVDRLWHLKSRAFLMIYHNGQTMRQTDLPDLKAIEEHPLLSEGAQLLTARSRFLHHHVRAALAFAQNKLEECERQLSANAQLLKVERRRFREEPDLLLGVMGNLAHVRMRLGKHQEAIDGFMEFRRIPGMMATAPSPDLEMKLFVMGSSLELSVLAMKGEFKEGLARLPAMESGLSRFNDRISVVRRAELLLQAAYISFGAAEYDNALRWCNRLLNEKGIEGHLELHALGRMLNILTLLELGKNDLLPYVLRNTQRFMRTRSHPHATEKALLAFVQARLHEQPRHGRKEPFRQLLDRLQDLAVNSQECVLLEQVDLVAWAMSKADGRSFAEVVQERWFASTTPKASSGKGPKQQRQAA